MVQGAPANVDSLLGRSVGHYRVDSLLGCGGMGAVYRAWDLSLERPVALKTVLFDSQHTRMLFVREARAQAKIRHPNVVPVHFIGDHEGLTYLVMELVEGESLAAKIEREGRLPEVRALEIIDAVAAALESAHGQGLIHRDVKPSNVLVETNGRVLLADFGLAKIVNAVIPAEESPNSNATGVDKSGGVTQTKGAIGTPAYIAPELTAGGTTIDHRADIYSLGVTLYELVTGARPFSGPTNTRVAAAHERSPVIAPRIIVPGLSAGCEAMILRMLAKMPEQRFPNYAELRRAIAESRVHRIPAPFLSRAGALAIDILPFTIVNLVLVQLFPRGWTRPLTWLAAAAIWAALEARTGATWGKRWIGIRTVDELGRPPALSRSFLRSVVKLWSPLLGALIEFLVASSGSVGIRIGNSAPSRSDSPMVAAVVTALWAIWAITFFLALGKTHKTIHDRIADTRVLLNLDAK